MKRKDTELAEYEKFKFFVLQSLVRDILDTSENDARLALWEEEGIFELRRVKEENNGR